MSKVEVRPEDKRRIYELAGVLQDALTQMGLFFQTREGEFIPVPVRRLTASVDPDTGRAVYGLAEVDVHRLPRKVTSDRLTHPRTIHHLTTVLGVKVRQLNTVGVTYCFELEVRPRNTLPKRVTLDLDNAPRVSESTTEGEFLLPIGVGRNGPVWKSIYETGHILVGGESGSGKSTWLNAMLVALLRRHTPEELRLAIVDPKAVEFAVYRGVPHLFGDVATGVDTAAALMQALADEMERRQGMFTPVFARSLRSYNGRADREHRLPLLLVVVDEVTDIALQAGLNSPFYRALIRLSSKGRALGLYLVLATQNPKAEVLNTLIRGNLGTRIAFRVASSEHSRTILGTGGAEDLPRTVRGRCLARLEDVPQALQGYYVPDRWVLALTDALRGSRLETKPRSPLTDAERELVRWAVEENEGYIALADIEERLSISQRQARQLGEQWEARGWLEKDSFAGNKRKVTDGLIETAGVGPV